MRWYARIPSAVFLEPGTSRGNYQAWVALPRAWTPTLPAVCARPATRWISILAE